MRSPKTVSLVAIAALVALVVAAGSALGANGSCPNGMPVCFAANTPAVASDANLNFSQLKEWLEAKVGPVSAPTVTTATTLNATTATLGALTTTGATTLAGPTTLTVMNGYQTSCFPGTASAPVVNVSCCRINMKDGTVFCHQATSQSLMAWSATISTPFTPQPAGYYTLSCYSGEAGYNFPGCCRTDTNSGAVVCFNAKDWALSTWYTQSQAF